MSSDDRTTGDIDDRSLALVVDAVPKSTSSKRRRQDDVESTNLIAPPLSPSSQLLVEAHSLLRCTVQQANASLSSMSERSEPIASSQSEIPKDGGPGSAMRPDYQQYSAESNRMVEERSRTSKLLKLEADYRNNEKIVSQTTMDSVVCGAVPTLARESSNCTSMELPYATSLSQYLEKGGSIRYRPRPGWLFRRNTDFPMVLNVSSCDHCQSDDEFDTVVILANSAQSDIDRSNVLSVVHNPSKSVVESVRQMSSDSETSNTTVFGRDWDSALHVAIRENATEAAVAMIDAVTFGSYVSRPSGCGEYRCRLLEAINAKGITPLILAAQKGNVTVVETLLHHDVSPVTASNNGTTAALQAAHFGHTEVLDRLLHAASSRNDMRRSSIIEAANANQTTPLMRAAQEGHEDAVRLLLQAGASVNRRNRMHLTALMLAAQRGHPSVCTALIKAGAEINAATGEQQSTALLLACKRGHIDVVRVLVAAGCDLWSTDRQGRTAQQLVKQNHDRRRRSIRSSGVPPTEGQTVDLNNDQILIDLLNPDTQVAMMQLNARCKRSYEMVRMWNLFQQHRADIPLSCGFTVSVHSISRVCDETYLPSSFNCARPLPALLSQYSNWANSSTQALVRTMALPAPLVEIIAQYLPLPRLWVQRISMLQSTCIANPDAGVTNALDFIDEILEVGGFLEACDAARIPAPVPFENWHDWKHNGIHGISSGDTTERGSSDSERAATTGRNRLAPTILLSVTEASAPRPRDPAHPTSRELRRQVGYVPLLFRYATSLGREVLAEPPYSMSPILLQQLVRIADIASLSRRLQGLGVHFDANVATDLLLLARRLTGWVGCRERRQNESGTATEPMFGHYSPQPRPW